MKRFRIFLAALLLIVLGTSAAFADVVSLPVYLVRTGAIYYIIAVIVIIVVLALLRRSIRRRNMAVDGMPPEEPDDKDAR
jgi:hypothetical protein